MKRLSCSLALAAMVASGASIAASNTDIRVTGAITPAACTPSISDGGVFDLGRIQASDLNYDVRTVLPTLDKDLTITCNAATRFALRGIDHRTASRSQTSDFLYGLGESRGKKIGHYSFYLQNTLLDGNASEVHYSEDNGASWISNGTLQGALYRHDTGLTGFGSIGSNAPTAITHLTSRMRLNTYIAAARSLDLTGDIPLDGEMTLEVHYL